VPEFSLVIVAWDRLDCTRRFVRQCLRDTDGDLEVIVVDNASTDGTQEWLSRESRNADKPLYWVRNAVNQGYPRGLNQGLRVANGEYLVALNNDIVVIYSNWLQQLVHPIRADRKTLVGARMIHGNHQVGVDGWTPSYLEGWCHAFHRDFLTEVGFYDEVYSPAFVEDVDLCWRAAAHGYSVVQDPAFEWTPEGNLTEGSLYHIYGATTYTPRAQGGHREDTRHMEITPRNVAVFRAKVRANDIRPFYPEGWTP
jgi:GT2 family glycosyltransferase